MTSKMNDKAYSLLRHNLITWQNLCKLDTNVNLVVCNYFNYKDFTELKEVCPKATSTRGKIFFRVKYLSDTLLRDLLTSIRSGLIELVNSGHATQIDTLIADIKHKDEDVYLDISNSTPNITALEQLQSLLSLIDTQINELNVLTYRLSEFKDLLAGISSFEEGVENLKDLLASIEEGNVDSYSELDTRLDRLKECSRV